MGRGNSESLGVLFSRQQRRAAGGQVAAERYRAALAGIERGDGALARRLLCEQTLDPALEQKLLGELTHQELFEVYDRQGARPDPGHPEYRIIGRAIRLELIARPQQPAAPRLSRKPPGEIWSCDPPGPLAEALIATLDVENPTAAHVQALAERPDGPLGDAARRQIFEIYSERIGKALRSIGLDDGSHRHTVRLSFGRERKLHLLRPPGPGAGPRTWCGVAAPLFERVAREESGSSIAGREDACRACLAAAQGERCDFTDPRPPIALFGDREAQVREALFGRFAEAARSFREKPQWASLLTAVAADEQTHEATSEALYELFVERLAASDARLSDLDWAADLAERHGDALIRDLLAPEELRGAVEELALALAPRGPLVRAVRAALK